MFCGTVPPSQCPYEDYSVVPMPLVTTAPKATNNPSCLSLTSLNTTDLQGLPDSLDREMWRRMQLESQGPFVSPDDAYAYSHESSVPPSYFKRELSLPCQVNMDRGGVVQRSDGTYAACIGDGVGGCGYFSAFVAQMISLCLLETLSQSVLPFTQSNEENKKIVTHVFQEVASRVAHLHASEVGESTALFVECVPTAQKDNGKQVYRVQGGALGDGAILHVNTEKKTATQLNAIHRSLDQFGKPDIYSPGGVISSRGLIYLPENIEAWTIEVTEDDYIVLVTDGFLDNVRDNRIADMTKVVIYEPFFDQSLDELLRFKRPWEKENRPILPTVEDVMLFIETNRIENVFSEVNPTAEQITKRLANYTKLVTYYCSFLEERAYTHFVRRIEDENSPKTDDVMIITISPVKK